MKITEIGKDYIKINDNSSLLFDNINESKVHLIKLDFSHPTREKVQKVFQQFNTTRRFIIDNNIRIYNQIFKNTRKKFYVENCEGDGFISFFKKNNKCLLNITRLSEFEKQFVLNICLKDILENIEVIYIEKDDFEDHIDIFNSWNGNVIVKDFDIYDSEWKS